MAWLRSRTRFELAHFEYALADARTALLRVEGSWRGRGPSPPTDVVILARSNSGTSRLEPLPAPPMAGTGRMWRAAYPASAALIGQRVQFELRAPGSKPWRLPAPEHRRLTSEPGEAMGERAARRLAEAELHDARLQLDHARSRIAALTAGILTAVETGTPRLDAVERRLLAAREDLSAVPEPGPDAESGRARLRRLAVDGVRDADRVQERLRAIRASLEPR